MTRLLVLLSGGVLCLGLLARPGVAAAQTDDAAARVAKVKSAFLLNFIRYSTWPETAFDDEQSPLVVTVVGHTPVLPYLRAIVHGEEAGGRPIVVRTLSYPDESRDSSEARERRERFLQALRRSHMVFVARAEAQHMDEVLLGLRGADVLCVSDIPDFVDEGGMLELALWRGRVVFDANLDAIHASAVNVSSKVLQLARNVREGG